MCQKRRGGGEGRGGGAETVCEWRGSFTRTGVVGVSIFIVNVLEGTSSSWDYPCSSGSTLNVLQISGGAGLLNQGTIKTKWRTSTHGKNVRDVLSDFSHSQTFLETVEG